MAYTITKVDQEREGDVYKTQYGTNKNYRVKFQETGDTVIQLSQKETTPPPKVGDVLEGTIDMSGKFGPKFRKEFSPKPNGHTPNAGFKGGKVDKDPHTIYVAYAKDIVVALLNNGDNTILPSDENFKEQFEKALDYVRTGATVLEMVAGGSSEGIEPPEGF